MKRAVPLIALAAFALLALAYSTTDADPTTTDVRKVDAFAQVEVAGMLPVEVHVGGPARVEIRGDADLVKQVITTVKNGVLVLDTPRDFAQRAKGDGKRNHRELRVIVTVPDLTRVAISGIGQLEVDGIAAKSFVASISGTGALGLAGKTEQLRLEITGAGEVKAKKLVANIVELAVPGTAKASLHAARSFDVDVSGTAVVAVHGKPASVKKHVDGVAMIDVK